MIVSLQRKFIYRPLRGQVNLNPSAVPSGMIRDVRVRTDDGLVLHGWHSTPRQGSSASRAMQRPFVIFFPGNSGHRGCRHRDFELFSQIGAELLLVDYRGFGENAGRPTESSLAMDARAVWRHTVEKLEVSPERIVLLGGSLGGGVATGLAHELCTRGTPAAALILRATFTSLADAGRALYPWLPVRRLLVEQFPSVDRIAGVTSPLMVVHGARDRVVPIEQGRKLFHAAPAHSTCGFEKQFVELPASGHHDILHTGWDIMRAEFDALLSAINRGRAAESRALEASS